LTLPQLGSIVVADGYNYHYQQHLCYQQSSNMSGMYSNESVENVVDVLLLSSQVLELILVFFSKK